MDVTWPDYKSGKQIEAHVSEQFGNDIADHVLTVVHADDHLVYLKAKRPTERMYWFDIVSTASQVTISGDMGTFVFTRWGTDNQLDLFNASRVNVGYWTSKLTAGDHEEYSTDAYVETVVEYATDYVDDLSTEDDGADEVAKFVSQVKSELLSWLPENEHEAYLKLYDSSVDHLEFDSENIVVTRPKYTYLWCLHALRWAATRYRDGNVSQAA